MLNQFVKGLSPGIQTHTNVQGPDTFEQAIHVATLYESAKAFTNDVTRLIQVHQQTQGDSQPQPRKPQPLDRPVCNYCKKLGHLIFDEITVLITQQKVEVSQALVG